LFAKIFASGLPEEKTPVKINKQKQTKTIIEKYKGIRNDSGWQIHPNSENAGSN